MITAFSPGGSDDSKSTPEPSTLLLIALGLTALKLSK
ncbi:MAG: PEP-CTERM sorting domain-containing protein [Porticoccaceae bacterium]|nr:PEP-CTERM sorting domain-containing protein [Porticoccaceae bacterium]